MKIMNFSTSLEVNNKALRDIRAQWPNTRSATPSQVAGKAKMIQDAAHAAYHRDKVLYDPFIKQMQDLIDGLKKPS